jgi:hypothetical protein
LGLHQKHLAKPYYKGLAKALEGIAKNLAIINNDRKDIIKVNSNEDGLLYTAREVAKGIKIKEEDLDHVTTNLSIK